MNSRTKRAIRRRLYIDQGLQNRLIVRTILQWGLYTSALLGVICVGIAWTSPGESINQNVLAGVSYLAPGVIASTLLLPVFVFDMLRATNRIAGPVYRLRNELKKLASGQDVRELRFRDGDSFNGLAEDFNALAQQVMDERRQRGSEVTPTSH